MPWQGLDESCGFAPKSCGKSGVCGKKATALLLQRSKAVSVLELRLNSTIIGLTESSRLGRSLPQPVQRF
jgi:hypothetical protein